MKKKTIHAFGNDYYLLGKHDGKPYWLMEPTWDCDWYWGLGYVDAFTNDKSPERSRDICGHSHFDSMFFAGDRMAYKAFKEFFDKTVLADGEIWELLDYMKTAYALKEAAAIARFGYSYFTGSAKTDSLVRPEEEGRINKELLPEVFGKIRKLLGGE